MIKFYQFEDDFGQEKISSEKRKKDYIIKPLPDIPEFRKLVHIWWSVHKEWVIQPAEYIIEPKNLVKREYRHTLKEIKRLPSKLCHKFVVFVFERKNSLKYRLDDTYIP